MRLQYLSDSHSLWPFDFASNRWAPQLPNVAAAFKSNEYLLKHCSYAVKGKSKQGSQKQKQRQRACPKAVKP